ncbi:KPN_02809 family neutral zinc metallopeptidase [Acaryochloris marina]|uniref:Neutral zinc metallopeptidase family n=1 Tax=Acaryochloris marina (strain MBIC 11017) TaxID=329726 RepID=B0CDD0_ACAM1|nr:neutral zinc metallopeptidase [Acaryochloris marina]ABW26855.1 neutral zinc metallopeptidase family [Acaryochloris marina MBIC11017]
MRWKMGRRSTNVEDRRGGSSMPTAAGGGLGILVITLVAAFFGIDPSLILDQANQFDNPPTTSAPDRRPAAENELADFVSVVLADTEDTWETLFRQGGQTYRKPKLVLFSGQTSSACGLGKAAMGPFYCPADQKVYIDLSFYKDLKERHQAPGDFAQAYVIAHEVGHHVQTLLGVSRKVYELRSRVSKVEGNQLSVRQELQADCFAGIWAHHANRTRQILEQGDIEEALNAASSIGDDRLQQQAGGRVTPESFTHGSSAQRVKWFKVGLQTGSLKDCDTFATRNL